MADAPKENGQPFYSDSADPEPQGNGRLSVEVDGVLIQCVDMSVVEVEHDGTRVVRVGDRLLGVPTRVVSCLSRFGPSGRTGDGAARVAVYGGPRRSASVHGGARRCGVVANPDVVRYGWTASDSCRRLWSVVDTCCRPSTWVGRVTRSAGKRETARSASAYLKTGLTPGSRLLVMSQSVIDD